MQAPSHPLLEQKAQGVPVGRGVGPPPDVGRGEGVPLPDGVDAGAGVPVAAGVGVPVAAGVATGDLDRAGIPRDAGPKRGPDGGGDGVPGEVASVPRRTATTTSASAAVGIPTAIPTLAARSPVVWGERRKRDRSGVRRIPSASIPATGAFA